MSCVYLLNKQQRLYSSFKCQHHCFTQPLPPVYPQINGGLTCNWSNYRILNNKEGGQKTCIEVVVSFVGGTTALGLEINKAAQSSDKSELN